MGLALLASLAAGGERTLEALRAEVASHPASAGARWNLASACEKAGAKADAQRAYWTAYLLAARTSPLRTKAREALFRLDKGWKTVFDLGKELGADWRKQTASIRGGASPEAAQLLDLWARVVPVVDEPWRSTKDPLAAFTKLTIEGKGKKLMGKGGVALLDMPPRQRKDLQGKTIVVEAIEVTIEGQTLANEPELEVTAQIAAGDVPWGKPGEDPKAPVWVHARRVGSRSDAAAPIHFWLRYYPPKGIGVGVPLADPRMRGSGKPLKLDRPLTASVRLESLLPRNRIQIAAIALTLYVRPTR